MSKIEVNTVAPQCGTTLTLGESGDTVTLGSGASQSGFGRTGTVDWQTTKKTTDFTAVNGEGYFVDTGGGVVTVTLPASPAAGNIVYIKDYDGNFGSNKCTIARNGSNIRGATNNFDLEASNAGAALIYVDATEGWQLFIDGSDSDAQPFFIEATGGNAVVTCGNFKTHIFTGPGTFSVTQTASSPTSNVFDYFVVAGGGGGAGNETNVGPTAGAGAGGAGGFRLANSYSLPAPLTSPLANPSGLTASIADFPITIGGGGPGGTAQQPVPSIIGTNGSPSTFSTITSAGGGFGLYHNVPGTPGVTGGPGGSGGGSGRDVGSPGGTGNTPPVSPPQGNNGGASNAGPYGGGGGGGGAGAVGGNSSTGNSEPTEVAGPGGIGSFIDANFVGPTAPSYGTAGPVSNTRYFSGGGGGGVWNNPPGLGTGGSGGGGAGALANGSGGTGTSGTVNTGGGGGGGLNGGGGGSGIVMIRYKFQ